MQLTIERFDTDETPRIRNTIRRTPKNATLPVDFPFLVDEDTGEIVEPVLIHLEAKFWGSGAIKDGRWRYRNSADAAASDLKDWWDYLDERKIAWNDVTDRQLSHYLKGLRETVSDQTGDFLADATFARRCASIESFHVFAGARWADGRYPSVVRACLIGGIGKRGPRSHRNEGEPHPLSPSNVNRIAGRLGPYPSERAPQQSSRSRLAFEIGLQTGMRIDEIVNLRSDVLDRLSIPNNGEPVPLKLKKTKGLVARTVFLPVELLQEIKIYIREERRDAVEVARKRWLGGEEREPSNLLLNQADAPADAGKVSTADTIEKAFHAVCMELGITVTKVIAEGADEEDQIVVPRHVFHDTRHTYAYWTYLGLTEQQSDRRVRQEPWLFIQSRLGHANVATTIGTYLRVFDELASETLVALSDYFRNTRAHLGSFQELVA